MIRLSWALAEGWIIGYLLSGPRRDPVIEAEVAFIMAVWRLTEAIRRSTPTAEEAAQSFQDFLASIDGATERAFGEAVK